MIFCSPSRVPGEGAEDVVEVVGEEDIGEVGGEDFGDFAELEKNCNGSLTVETAILLYFLTLVLRIFPPPNDKKINIFQADFLLFVFVLFKEIPRRY